jgi:hypothetical protein
MVAYAFTRVWLACGLPTITVIGPYTEWPMPRGYHYDAGVDRIVNDLGETVEDLSLYWITHTVNVIPAAALDEAMMLGEAGIVPGGSTAFVILASDITTMRNAFQVQVDGCWYIVTDVKPEPAGATANWAVVQLKRRS